MPKRNASDASGRRTQPKRPKESQAATTATESARGHAAKKHPEVFCDRPGCYEPVRESPCAPASYCGDECRTAVNRVRDRERKGLLRKRLAGRIKRQLEYQAAREKRCGQRRPFLDGSVAASSSVPPCTGLSACGRKF